MNHVSIGMKAPDFTANTTMGTKSLSDYAGKWVLLFSHPGDFTPVTKVETNKGACIYEIQLKSYYEKSMGNKEKE